MKACGFGGGGGDDDDVVVMVWRGYSTIERAYAGHGESYARQHTRHRQQSNLSYICHIYSTLYSLL